MHGYKHGQEKGGDKTEFQAEGAESSVAQVDVKPDFFSAQGRILSKCGFVLLEGGKIRSDDDEAERDQKWFSFIQAQPLFQVLAKSPDIKQLIRCGIPHEFRERTWRSCIDMIVRPTRFKLGIKYYRDLVSRGEGRYNPTTQQIELDLLRTFPDNIYFATMESLYIPNLRRVLTSYSIHNPAVGYCQGLNKIAAIALLVFKEEDAFWCLVAIIEHLMPPDYFTNFAAAKADQFVLLELLACKCSKLQKHMERHNVDITFVTIKFFLTIFGDGVEPELFLRIWDSFLNEGSKVLFRFALAMLKYSEQELLKQTDKISIIKYLTELGKRLTDVKQIAKIAFVDLNPFPMKSIAEKRELYLQKVKLDLENQERKSSHEAEEQKGASQFYVSLT